MSLHHRKYSIPIIVISITLSIWMFVTLSVGEGSRALVGYPYGYIIPGLWIVLLISVFTVHHVFFTRETPLPARLLTLMAFLVYAISMILLGMNILSMEAGRPRPFSIPPLFTLSAMCFYFAARLLESTTVKPENKKWQWVVVSVFIAVAAFLLVVLQGN